MSKRSKHDKVMGHVIHDAEVQIPNLREFMQEAGRVDQGLPPYSPVTEYVPLTDDELYPYDKHEHDLLVARITNQRRELRRLNRAIKRQADKYELKLSLGRETRAGLQTALETRNRSLAELQKRVGQLEAENALLARKYKAAADKKGIRWPLIG